MRIYLEDGRSLKFKKKDAEKVAFFLDVIFSCLERLNSAADLDSIQLNTEDLDLTVPPFLELKSADGLSLSYFNVSRSLENELSDILHDDFVQRGITWKNALIYTGIES